jgi:hypothetical protein
MDSFVSQDKVVVALKWPSFFSSPNSFELFGSKIVFDVSHVMQKFKAWMPLA